MKGKFFAGILLGAAAAAGIAYFLNTEKGKELVAELKEKANDLENDFKETAAETKEELNDLVQKTKSKLAELEKKMNSFNV